MPDSLPKGLGPNAKFIGVKGARRRLSTPGLLLDVDALDHNIAAMASRAAVHGVGLRPHSKGAKSIAIARRRIKAGGDVKAALAIIPITKPLFAHYRKMIAADYPHLEV